jgi:hypothetical protein
MPFNCRNEGSKCIAEEVEEEDEEEEEQEEEEEEEKAEKEERRRKVIQLRKRGFKVRVGDVAGSI